MTNITQEVFDRMVAHIDRGTTDMAETELRVPAFNFSSDAHLADERAVFRRQFLVAATASELPEPGSFVTRDLLGTAVLIVRQKDGAVRCFRNMCRHRGGKVEMAESGRKSAFVCAYHGWSYDRSGDLRGIPFKESFDPIDPACNGLFRVHCEERHGLVWVDLSDDAGRDVATFLGAQADEQLATFALDRTTVFLERKYDLEVNWKLVMDGAYDVLHPQFLHPNGVGKLVHTNVGIWKDYGLHGQMFTARKRLADAVRNGATPEAAWRYFATVFVLFPNTLVIAAPDHYEFWTVWPGETAGRCTVHIRFLIDPAKLTGDMPDRLNRSLAILEDAAMNEDWPMEQTIQANAASSPDATYLYGRSEISCQHLHLRLASAIAAAG
ncbi:aromatic ring-hydroxylating dioxygenase subunit alpha [Sphingomonas sp. CL5.1]|uniref:aromatic ring-hydroxylating oxygenase subunit alpha n=1 Tax=Sphingomonas sp. CL5.1 TaxID=2653203 RepID=UPI0015818C10|nr:aromatic ring-hydroxylating dioxygenase subunit alpha [Sphingomonas sp. CL5.1]QKR98384.1 aromatic ring-hydroxylating dioxygenase subunit alpha [Sphingomonas sp. CL5.1]